MSHIIVSHAFVRCHISSSVTRSWDVTYHRQWRVREMSHIIVSDAFVRCHISSSVTRSWDVTYNSQSYVIPHSSCGYVVSSWFSTDMHLDIYEIQQIGTHLNFFMWAQLCPHTIAHITFPGRKFILFQTQQTWDWNFGQPRLAYATSSHMTESRRYCHDVLVRCHTYDWVMSHVTHMTEFNAVSRS